MEKLSKLLQQAQEFEQTRRTLLERGKLRLEPETKRAIREDPQEPQAAPTPPQNREV